MVIYTAGSIDYNTEIQSWKDTLKKYIFGVSPETVFYNPVEAFTVGIVLDTTAAQYIYDVNMIALEEADIIVAYMSSKSASVGTPIEIATASSKQIPLIIFTDMHKSVYLKYYESQGAIVVASDQEDAVHKLCTTVNNLVGKLNDLADNYPKRFHVNTEQQ